ncbi:MAG: hypothetical protein D6B28_08410 [Gammaproteobacteria bacterium]|nr:MAG: hypothetical protein D6B28_08410 [Gammaproteobacteria bacterium]
MSYILDALKKSEHEREQAEREQQGAAKAALAYENEEPKKGKNFGALIGLIVVINIALAGYIFLNNDAPESSVTAKTQEQKPQPKPLPKPKPIARPAEKNGTEKIAKTVPGKPSDKASVVKKPVVKKPAAPTTKPRKILRSESNKRLAQKQVVKPEDKPGQIVEIDPKRAVKQIDTQKVALQPKQVASIDTQKQTAKMAGRLPVPPEIDTRPVKQQRKVAKPKGLKRTRVGVEQTNTRVTSVKAKPDPKPVSQPKSSPKVIYSKVELTADPNDIPDQVSSTPVNSSRLKPARKPRVPNFMDMDPDFRRTFPKIDINVHVYADEPNDRFALIEMKRYGEGDTLSGNIKIREITPEGFILLYKGKTFLYPAK